MGRPSGTGRCYGRAIIRTGLHAAAWAPTHRARTVRVAALRCSFESKAQAAPITQKGALKPMPGFSLAAGRVSDTELKPKIESYRPPALVMPTPEFDALAARNARSQSPTAAGTAQRAEKARGRGCESSPTHAKKIARDRPSAACAAGRQALLGCEPGTARH